MDNRVLCYRTNGTCYAAYAPREWIALRNAGTLEDDLKRRRDSGAVIEVARVASAVAVPHFKPREHEGVPAFNPTTVEPSIADEWTQERDDDFAGAVAAMAEDMDNGASFEQSLEHYADLYRIAPAALRHEWALRTEEGAVS